MNRTQGRDLFAPDYLEAKTKEPSCFVVAAFQDLELIGVAVAQLLSNNDYYQPFSPLIVDHLYQKRVGSLSTSCVREDVQGKGVGSELMRVRLEWLRSKTCNSFVGISWVSGKPHTSNRVFEKFGFKKVNEVKNFFYQASLDHPFVCPACGGPPCICSAIMYLKDEDSLIF